MNYSIPRDSHLLFENMAGILCCAGSNNHNIVPDSDENQLFHTTPSPDMLCVWIEEDERVRRWVSLETIVTYGECTRKLLDEFIETLNSTMSVPAMLKGSEVQHSMISGWLSGEGKRYGYVLSSKDKLIRIQDKPEMIKGEINALRTLLNYHEGRAAIVRCKIDYKLNELRQAEEDLGKRKIEEDIPIQPNLSKTQPDKKRKRPQERHPTGVSHRKTRSLTNKRKYNSLLFDK